MSLQNALGNSLFVHLEEIAKRYHIEYYYYFDPEYAKKTGDNSEYFILFHEQYREKIEDGNIPELYMQQKGKYFLLYTSVSAYAVLPAFFTGTVL